MNDLDPIYLHWLDPATLAFTPARIEGARLILGYRDDIHLRASADGSLFGLWLGGRSPSGVGSLLVGRPTSKYYYAHESAGDLLPGATGKFLCTGGGLYNPEAKIAEPQGWCVASLEGDYFLSFGALGPKEREAKVLEAKVMMYVRQGRVAGHLGHRECCGRLRHHRFHI